MTGSVSGAGQDRRADWAGAQSDEAQNARTDHAIFVRQFLELCRGVRRPRLPGPPPSGARRDSTFLPVADNVRSEKIVPVMCATVRLGDRMLDLPSPPTPRVAVVRKGEATMTDVAATIGAGENPLKLRLRIGHVRRKLEVWFPTTLPSLGSLNRTAQDKKHILNLVCKTEPSLMRWDMGTPVGNRIRNLRVEMGLSLPGLAEKADLSKGLLYQIETSEDANPSLGTLNKIANGLGVTIAALLEKETVQAKRIIPESLDPGLEAFIKSARENGEPLNQSTLQALYVLQHRSGAGAKTKEDWAWLYQSIEFSFGHKVRRNAPGG